MANPANDENPVNRLIKHIKLEKNDIRRLVLLTISIGILSLATPIAVQSLVNIVTMGGVLEPLYVVSFMLFLILCLSGTLYVLERYIVELIQRRFFIRTAISTAINTQSAKVEIHDQYNSVELMNRFFDVTTVQKSSATLLTYGLSATLQGIIGSIVLMFYNLYFAIIVIMVLLVVYLVIFKIGQRATQTAIQESKSKYKVAAWLEILARNAVSFKFLNANTYGLQKADYLANQYLSDRKAHFHTLLYQSITGVAIYALAGTAMLALGGALVIQGQINLGQFVAAELIIFSVLIAYRKFVEYLEYYYDLVAAFDKLGMIDDMPNEKYGKHKLNGVEGLSLQVNNVSYALPYQAPLIENLSFSLPPNQSVCIVGQSGSGKTTLAELVTGLRFAQQGFVEYNGINISELDLSDVRQHIGFAGQLEVIESSIIDNIRMGRADIPLEKVIQVLKSLDVYDKIIALKDGLDTILMPTGAPLSFQQTQLILLTRCLVGEPKLVIIDEILDHLDATSVSSVMALFMLKTRHYSLIVLTKNQAIAHYPFNQHIKLDHE